MLVAVQLLLLMSSLPSLLNTLKSKVCEGVFLYTIALNVCDTFA